MAHLIDNTKYLNKILHKIDQTDNIFGTSEKPLSLLEQFLTLDNRVKTPRRIYSDETLSPLVTLYQRNRNMYSRVWITPPTKSKSKYHG